MDVLTVGQTVFAAVCVFAACGITFWLGWDIGRGKHFRRGWEAFERHVSAEHAKRPLLHGEVERGKGGLWRWKIVDLSRDESMAIMPGGFKTRRAAVANLKRVVRARIVLGPELAEAEVAEARLAEEASE